MRRIHYSWIIAAVGFITPITSAGFRSTSGVLIVPLQDEFGWSRATLGLAVSLNLLMFGLAGRSRRVRRALRDASGDHRSAPHGVGGGRS